MDKELDQLNNALAKIVEVRQEIDALSGREITFPILAKLDEARDNLLNVKAEWIDLTEKIGKIKEAITRRMSK